MARESGSIDAQGDLRRSHAPAEVTAALVDSDLHPMDWYVEGKVRPHISATFTFDDAAAALNTLAERRVKGKIVMVPG